MRELPRPATHATADHEAHDAARGVVEPGAAEEAQHFVEHLRGVAVAPLAVGPTEELERVADVLLPLRAEYGAYLGRGEHAEEVAEMGLQLRAPRAAELEQLAGVAHEAAARLLREVIFSRKFLAGGDGGDFSGRGRGGCGCGAEEAGLEEEQWVLG